MSEQTERIPVIESFGPVLQGEGMLVGKPTWFLRLGACDYLCTHCDSMHAVDGKSIAKIATIMSAEQITERMLIEMNTPRVKSPMLTISGGNPALWDLVSMVVTLQEHNKMVAVETQGTIYKPWLNLVDYLTISPKGPGMIRDWEAGIERFKSFLDELRCATVYNKQLRMCVKIPVFDSSDLLFAERIVTILQAWRLIMPPVYLSIGNSWVDPMHDKPALRMLILERYNKLSQIMMSQHPLLQGCAMFPQQHVLQYANELRR